MKRYDESILQDCARPATVFVDIPAFHSARSAVGDALRRAHRNRSKMVEGQRELLLQNTKDMVQRATSLTQIASVDPVWAADFIAEHPLPKNSPPYDQNATLKILSRASEISEERMFWLINNAPFLREGYAVEALESIPLEAKELRQRIIRAGLAQPANAVTTPRSFENRLKLAEASSDPNDAKQVRTAIDKYYRSGQAMKAREKHKSIALPKGVRSEQAKWTTSMLYSSVLLRRK